MKEHAIVWEGYEYVFRSELVRTPEPCIMCDGKADDVDVYERRAGLAVRVCRKCLGPPPQPWSVIGPLARGALWRMAHPYQRAAVPAVPGGSPVFPKRRGTVFAAPRAPVQGLRHPRPGAGFAECFVTDDRGRTLSLPVQLCPECGEEAGDYEPSCICLIARTVQEADDLRARARRRKARREARAAKRRASRAR